MDSEILKRLLRRVGGSEVGGISELARELGTSPVLVEQMIATLTQVGYLEAVVPGCATPCERCPVHTMCLYRRQPRVWIVTEKGRQFVSG